MSAKFWLETKTPPHTTIAVDSSPFANTPIHGGMNSFGGFNPPVLVSLSAAASVFTVALPCRDKQPEFPPTKKGIEMPKKTEHIQPGGPI
jgi:hypothetical protein